MIAERPSQRRRANDHQEPVAPPARPPVVVDEASLPIAVPPEADLTYADLVQRAPPRDPVAEEYQPKLTPAIYQPTHVQVADAQGRIVNDTTTPGAPPPIGLVAAGDNATHAYAFLPDSKPIRLKHAPNWGEVRFAVVYSRHVNDAPGVFRAPDPRKGTPSYVAIKMLNKAVVDQHLAAGGRENPYKEICRCQALGDNIHVIMCEALQDDERLYMITPKGKPLVDQIFSRRTPLPAAQVHAYVLQMLRILVYLAKHDIHHRDLSPDNLFILPNGQLVLTDMAMSLKIPRDANNQRILLKDQGTFGTAAWMAPEIFHRFPFDGVTADLWCVMHIAYNCLTGHLLYRRPHPTDWSYLFFVIAGGLTADALNEQAMEVLQDLSEHGEAQDLQRIQEQAMAHMAFGPRVREFLSRVLTNAPHERWNLGQVLRSDYVVHGPD